ncbi:uncharacterized protein LOC129758446 isoform X2 [Uranotaenia lowii]|uniref:uncharacterized protein LOC129758446 isoform X2 n=1 Tax=Uranotaenia lowii TaxID=190385 RepID=UPI00247A00FA|nr:uncharacterized protein LOC129758446 isoform X2 [Uranotaenia lowii]
MGPKKGTLQRSSKEKRPRSYPVSGDKPAASKPTFLESDQDPDPGSENDPDELRSGKVHRERQIRYFECRYRKLSSKGYNG